jgi:hypothetical protein
MKTVSYRIVHAGDTLTTWKTNESNLSTLVHREDGCRCGEDAAHCEDAVTRCEVAAERDYGDMLPWIVAENPNSSLVVWTGPLAVDRRVAADHEPIYPRR